MCVFNTLIKGNKTDCFFYKIHFIKEKALLDNQSFCIFHSEDEEWKNENNFIHHLEELISYFEAEPLQETIILDSIIFIGVLDGIFSNQEFKKNISFKQSQFIEDLKIESTTFKDLNFELAIFNKKVAFSNVSIKKATFDKAHFKSNTNLRDCNFYLDFFMLKTMFSGGLSIVNSSFRSKSFFESIKTNLDSSIRQGVVFKNIQFKDFTTFELSEFNAITDFVKIEIESELIFHNTQFNYNEPVPYTSSITFNEVHIKEKGRLEFRGNTDNKTFNKVQDVGFLKENIEGALFFEHIDFTKFSTSSRNRLIVATKEKNAKVIIGAGCIKYYNQTPVKAIEISNDNQNLAVELCNTFVEYFTNNEGFNLGVEFISKTEEHINFFYFSDEVIPYKEFEAKLQKSEESMWRLIKVEGDGLKAKPIQDNLPSRIVNATDTMVNLFSLVLKIGSRIPLGLISKEEITHLLNTTLPSNSREINGLVVNQIVLFGINNRQSFEVKKID